jgi:hypothetical protein
MMAPSIKGRAPGALHGLLFNRVEWQKEQESYDS